MSIRASWRFAIAVCRAVSAHHAEAARRADMARVATEARRATAAHSGRRIRLQPSSIALAVAMLAIASVPVVSAAGTSALAPAARFHGSGQRTGAWLVQFRADVTDADA